ncbi:adhesion G-protein coupled receptor G5-like isoform X2 [Anabas testudineus]|uniref:adhesion G-protein coupled receptor G5-like isoform X2 n=1 Tax=Anabas testudineus TaxID=64144 RepID=UPI000E460C0C|nr:adhesion G-protein coupled receptor G5-like isoform X2 [Anabas testudineus]
MFPLELKHFWAFLVQILLMYGTFLYNCLGETCERKNILFVSFVNVTEPQCHFPSGFNYEFSGKKICFVYQENIANADCCQKTGFNCNFTVTPLGDDIYRIVLNKHILTDQDIVLAMQPLKDIQCMPSTLYNKTDSLLNIHNCFQTDSSENYYNFTIRPNHTINCPIYDPQGNKSSIQITLHATDTTDPKQAVEIMKNLSYLLEKMGSANTATITAGNVTGVMTKLPPVKESKSITVGITAQGDMNFVEGSNADTKFPSLVFIPAEASSMAVDRNGSFAGVLLFPGMKQDDPKSFFLNNEVVGIEMGAPINHLNQTINILYTEVNKMGNIASCRSWNGTEKATWITDGCKTVETNGSITCQCSHLTFFALLMSPPPTNISAADYRSLSYITSIGCGLSMFFLIVALFMHCLIRKGKASQATKILMNLFIAMLVLNLSFLVNESIANLGSGIACVVTAAVMHYSMLATFSWFLVEALHMYFNLHKSLNKTKHYMFCMHITGWATPAIVVICLLALNKYDYMVIYTDDGNSSKMCWISDAIIQQGVNIGYYAIVFIFTLSIFIVTVRLMVTFKPAAGKVEHNISAKTNFFSILSLFILLGITWAFAFFSYGPLLIPSYYIFTILNSFQGFFLFIYYYNTSKIVGDGRNLTLDRSSTPTSNTYVSSPK